jgi:hypothetical protein
MLAIASRLNTIKGLSTFEIAHVASRRLLLVYSAHDRVGTLENSRILL